MNNLLRQISSIDKDNHVTEAQMPPLKNSAIPKMIHFFWAGGAKPMPETNIECVAAWAEKNPEFRTIIWVDTKTTPSSVFKNYLENEPPKGIKGTNIVLADVNSNGLIPEETENDITFKSPQRLLINALRPNYGGSSDILRYLVLHKFGGAYFDSDILPGSKKLNHDKVFDNSKGEVLLLNPTTQNIRAAGNDSFICTPGNPIMLGIAKTAVSNYSKSFYRKDYPYHQPHTYFNLDNKMMDTVTRTGPIAVRRTFLERNELGRYQEKIIKKYPFGGTQSKYVFDNSDANLYTCLEVPSKYWMSEEYSQALPENQGNWLIPLVQAMPKKEALEIAIKEVLFEANNQGLMRLDDHIEDVAISMSLDEINKQISKGNQISFIDEFKSLDFTGYMMSAEQLELLSKLKDRDPVPTALGDAIRKINTKDDLNIKEKVALIEFLTKSTAVKEIFGSNLDAILNKFMQRKFNEQEYIQLKQALKGEGLSLDDIMIINSMISSSLIPGSIKKLVTSLAQRNSVDQDDRNHLNQFICAEKLTKKMPLNYMEKYTLAQMMSRRHLSEIAESMLEKLNFYVKYNLLQTDNVDYAQLMSKYPSVRKFYVHHIPHALDDQMDSDYVFSTISKGMSISDATFMGLDYIQFLYTHNNDRFNHLKTLLNTPSFKNTEENSQILESIKNNIQESVDKQKSVYGQLEKNFETLTQRLNDNLSHEIIIAQSKASIIREHLDYILQQLPEMMNFAQSSFMNKFITQLMETLHEPLTEDNLLVQLEHAQKIVNAVCNFTSADIPAYKLLKDWPPTKHDKIFNTPDALQINMANIIFFHYKMINCQSIINEYNGMFSERNEKFKFKEQVSLLKSKGTSSDKKNVKKEPITTKQPDTKLTMESLGWGTRIKNNKFSLLSQYGNDSADINIDNQRDDEHYLLQAHDINYVGDMLLRSNGDLLKTYFLPVQQSHLHLASADIARSLEINAKDKVLAGQDVVSIFNKNANHWVSFKISNTGDKEITVLYKDSYGAKYPEEFEKIIENTFPGFKIRYVYSNTKEQNDGVSCGVFALRNMIALAKIDGKNVAVIKDVKDESSNTFQNNDVFYQPGVNEQTTIIKERTRFAELYLKKSEEMQHDALQKKKLIDKTDKETAQPLTELFSNNRTIGKLIREKMVRSSFSIGFRSVPDSQILLLNINLKNDLVGKHNAFVKLLKEHGIKFDIQDEPRSECRHIILTKGEAEKLLAILKKDSSSLDKILPDLTTKTPSVETFYTGVVQPPQSSSKDTKTALRFQSHVLSRVDALNINLFNQQSDSEYQLQSHDINYVADKLFRGHKNSYFLPVQQNHLRLASIGIKLALETTAKSKIESNQDVLSIFNKSANHWVAYRIAKTNDGELTVLYKDSYGDKYPDEFAKMVAQAFPEYKINFVYSNSKEQQDGVSCGIFALRNLERLSQIKTQNIAGSYQQNNDELIFKEIQPFYNPHKEVKDNSVLIKERQTFGSLYSERSVEVEEDALFNKRLIEKLDSNITDIILSTMMTNEKLSNWICEQSKEKSFSMGFRLLPDSVESCFNINLKNSALLRKDVFINFLNDNNIPFKYDLEPKGECGHIIISEKQAKNLLSILSQNKKTLEYLAESLTSTEHLVKRFK